jgi:uncharacterized protein
MARPKSLRKVVKPPAFKGYKPYGVSGESAGTVEFLYEEYESLKLADYDLMNHMEASKVMGVSRATFARIYAGARRKIAQAFAEVKEITVAYGNAVLDKSWLVCNNCHARFTIPEGMANRDCPVCKSNNVVVIEK